MATLTVSVALSDEDAQEDQDATGFSSTATSLNAKSDTSLAARKDLGMMFVSSGISQGDTVDSATVDVHIMSGARDDANVSMHCEDADTPVDYTADADLVGRTKTSSKSDWIANSIGSGIATSPTFTSAVQELVNRGGWSTGNYIHVIFRGINDVAKHLRVAAQDHSTLPAPELTVVYTPAAAGLSIPVAMHHYSKTIGS